MSQQQSAQVPWSVIDPEQFVRIGKVHEGFFYQHLLGVSLVLNCVEAPGSILRLRIESDEDLEVQLSRDYLYLQVKTTDDNLVFSEIAPAVVRFHALRQLHAEGMRPGSCAVAMAVAGHLGPELTAQAGSTPSGSFKNKLIELAQSNQINPENLIETWTSIKWVLPGQPIPGLSMVRVLRDAPAMFDDLVARARTVPRLSSSPESAVLAVTAAITRIAADSHPHVRGRVLDRAECELLLERIARLPEQLPPVPADFIPLGVPRPLIQTAQKVCFIGGSGSGKSTHLAFEAACSDAKHVIYLVLRGDGPDILTSDLIAQLGSGLPTESAPSGIANMASVGISMEERLDRLAAAIPSGSAVLLDNAHKLVPGTEAVGAFIRRLVTRSDIALVLAGQPLRTDGGPTLAVLFSLAGRALNVVDVPGWDELQISRWGVATGNPLTPPQSSRVRLITSGSPLAVDNLLRVAREAHAGDVDRAIHETHLGGIHADAGVVFERTFDILPDVARRASCILSSVGFRPTVGELERIIGREETASAIRRLLDYRAARLAQTASQEQQRIHLHDAYIAIARQRIAEVFPAEKRREAHRRAIDIVVENFKRGNTGLEWITAFYSNLLNAGEIENAVDYLTDESPLSVEALNRRGLGPWLVELIQEFLLQTSESELRYWLRDGLIFLANAGEAVAGADALWTDQIREVAEMHTPPINLLMSFAHKQIVHLQKRGDMEEAEKIWRNSRGKASDESQRLRLDYQWAVVLYRENQLNKALELLSDMIGHFCKLLGIKLHEIWGESPDDIEDKIHGFTTENVTMLSRLSDCLDLAGRCFIAKNLHPTALFIQAGMLYGISGQSEPLVKAGILLGELQLNTGFTQQALWALTNILQIIEARGLSGYKLECLALQACAAAEIGDSKTAQAILDHLGIYQTSEVEDLLTRARQAIQSSPRAPATKREPELDRFMQKILE